MTEDEFYAGLPQKRVVAGTLFTDEKGRLLILKPSYKDGWTVPGGMVEPRESPRDACIREVREELGFAFEPGHLLCVDYNTYSDSGSKSESIKLVFDGGVLDEKGIGKIAIDGKEIVAYEFAEIDDACTRLNPHLAKRVPHALKARENGTTAYLEEGNLVL